MTACDQGDPPSAMPRIGMAGHHHMPVARRSGLC
jgi:hypothetical protein